MVPLKTITATEAARVLQEAFNLGPAKRLVVSVDERTNSLIIRATPQDFKAVEALIRQLEEKGGKAETTPDRVFKVIALKKLDAAAVVQVLEKVFQGSKSRFIAVNEKTLAVYLTVEEMVEVEKIIIQLESPQP